MNQEISLPSNVQNVDRNMMHEHEKRHAIERPDMTYVWSAADFVLRRYPRAVRAQNDLLRVEIGAISLYRYAWVHAHDLTQRYVDPNTHSVHWLPRFTTEDRYYLCFLEPTTFAQQALRVSAGQAYKHGVDFQAANVNGNQVRTEAGKLPDVDRTWRLIHIIKESLMRHSNMGTRVYNLLKGMNRCGASEGASARIDDLMPLRFPGSVDGSLGFVNDSKGKSRAEVNARLEQAGIGDSPAAKK